ncbi:MAG TPA: ParA family protein [Terriglobia bacterium]|nr:ParA family protein [Terriglobia bacterium]
MPTIAFVSPKGGAGKTTSALLLAQELSRAAPVTIVDADPNRPIKTWHDGGNAPENLRVVSDADEETIIDRVEEAQANTPFVVIDLEGTAAKIVLLAIAVADFVVIPTQGSELDAAQSARAIRAVRQQEKMSGRPKPFAVLLTRTSAAIMSRTMQHLQNSMAQAGIPMLATTLVEREAFKAMFSFKQTLEGLSSTNVSGLDKARANAEAFTAEIIEELKKAKARSAA